MGIDEPEKATIHLLEDGLYTPSIYTVVLVAVVLSLLVAGGIILVRPPSTASGQVVAAGTVELFLVGIVAIGIFAFVVDWYVDRKQSNLVKELIGRIMTTTTPSPPKTEKIGTQEWITFIEARLDSWDKWIQALVAIGGLVPLTSLVPNTAVVPLFVANVSVVLAGSVILLALVLSVTVRFLWKRRGLLLVETLVLSEQLRSNQAIGAAYHLVSLT